jgi:hypothetical protein
MMLAESNLRLVGLIAVAAGSAVMKTSKLRSGVIVLNLPCRSSSTRRAPRFWGPPPGARAQTT